MEEILKKSDFDDLCDDFMDYEGMDEEEEFLDTNQLDTKDGCPAYELIYANKLAENEKPLGKVIGHENQKKELLAVMDWFKRSKELKEKGVSIPKGVLLFGEPGNGKSLFIKEIIRCIDAPVFVFQGEQGDVVSGIYETFEKARETGHAVIVFDELDLLINKERRVVRALQENLDGVESSDDILVLAATNYIREIPSPLMRCGRLEKLIKVPFPTGKEALALMKKHFKEFKVELPSDFDDEEIQLSLNGISCVAIKSIVNDVVLRNGFEDITVDMIYNSIYNVTDRVKDTPDEDNIEVSTHEAGHAIMAKKYPEYFMINRLNISGASGEFHAKEVERDFWPYQKILADIEISMAGVLAQKIIYGRGSRGCENDLETARMVAYNLINKCGYSSCWETLPTVNPHSRKETEVKRRKMERKCEAVLRKCEANAKKYLKKHVGEIKTLAQALFEKKHLKSSEILALIG